MEHHLWGWRPVHVFRDQPQGEVQEPQRYVWAHRGGRVWVVDPSGGKYALTHTKINHNKGVEHLNIPAVCRWAATVKEEGDLPEACSLSRLLVRRLVAVLRCGHVHGRQEWSQHAALRWPSGRHMKLSVADRGLLLRKIRNQKKKKAQAIKHFWSRFFRGDNQLFLI